MKQSSINIQLYPHRSLSRKGFAILMGCIATVSFVAGIAFLIMGAWPVLGFFGLDVILIWLAIRYNYRDAQCYETIEIKDDVILITKVSARTPQKTVKLIRAWAGVRLEEDVERELIGRLFLYSKDVVTEIGSFLAPYDRKSLARELNSILIAPRI